MEANPGDNSDSVKSANILTNVLRPLVVERSCHHHSITPLKDSAGYRTNARNVTYFLCVGSGFSGSFVCLTSRFAAG